ncbi:hypothetical protein H4582DRAFT_2089682 [Lactarius indigo]|nr:hypothetical protein H4582DRAFT_2089682 [Lactarius indigo]
MPTSPLRHVTQAALLNSLANDARVLLEDDADTEIPNTQLTPWTPLRPQEGPITAQEWAHVVSRFPDPTQHPDDKHAVVHVFRNDAGEREPIAAIPPSDDLIGVRGVFPSNDERSSSPGVRIGGLEESSGGVAEGAAGLSRSPTEGDARAAAAMAAAEAGHDDSDYYPVRHPFLQTKCDADNPLITPWLVYTDSSPMYRGCVRVPGAADHRPFTAAEDPAHVIVPEGFRANRRPHYIRYPITGPDGVEWDASHVQIIGGADPMILGVIPGSPHVYGKPFYAEPHVSAALCPQYPHEDLVIFTADKITNRALNRINDESLTAEVTRYRAASYELDRLRARISQLRAMVECAQDDKRDSIYRLEHATALERIADEQRDWPPRDFRGSHHQDVPGSVVDVRGCRLSEDDIYFENVLRIAGEPFVLASQQFLHPLLSRLSPSPKRSAPITDVVTASNISEDARADAASLRTLQASELQDWIISNNGLALPESKRKDDLIFKSPEFAQVSQSSIDEEEGSHWTWLLRESAPAPFSGSTMYWQPSGDNLTTEAIEIVKRACDKRSRY